MLVTIKPLSIALWGPVALHGYGIAVLAGVLLVYYALLNDPLCKKIITRTQLDTLTSGSIISGFLGSKLLYTLIEESNFSLSALCTPWQGGLSVLGMVVSVALYILYATYSYRIPLLMLMERLAVYVPLGHALGRLGCWWAGCCFGIAATANTAFSCCYEGSTAGAACYVPLVPIQLYSALFYCVLFVILKLTSAYLHKQHFSAPSTRVIGLYLMGVGSERLLLDFWRGDRVMMSYPHPVVPFLSVYQLLAVVIVCIGLCIVLTGMRRTRSA